MEHWDTVLCYHFFIKIKEKSQELFKKFQNTILIWKPAEDQEISPKFFVLLLTRIVFSLTYQAL